MKTRSTNEQLTSAISANNLKLMKKFISDGGDVDVCIDNLPLLFIAIKNQQRDIVKLLLPKTKKNLTYKITYTSSGEDKLTTEQFFGPIEFSVRYGYYSMAIL